MKAFKILISIAIGIGLGMLLGPLGIFLAFIIGAAINGPEHPERIK